MLVAKDGVVVKHGAYGHALKYADDGPTLLPEGEQVPMERETIFDLASVSKLFTSIAAVQLFERGRLDLDAPVARYIPPFAHNRKESVTARHLLTHTSGFAPWLPLYSRHATLKERVAAVYRQELEVPPGTSYVYSDLNMITLGKLVEEVSGCPLDRFVAENIAAPLNMADTDYNPPEYKLDRIAATEYQPWTGRGMIQGEVHDENAWALEGVAGHAGVFGTARDLARLSQALLNGGGYGGARILDPDSVRLLLTNFNESFSGEDHGLGFELYRHRYMDAMATPVTAGHAGFTGTSVTINPLDGSFAILLTNRVHPTRTRGSIDPNRRAVARSLARAVPVKPADGGEAWFSGLGEGLDNTLELPLTLPTGSKELRFELWYDTEPGSDYGTVEVSTDRGYTWRPLWGTVAASGSRRVGTYRLTGWSGRIWLDARYDLGRHSGPIKLCLRYTTDATASGRGVYVDRVRIEGPGGTLFDETRPADDALWKPRGWSRRTD